MIVLGLHLSIAAAMKIVSPIRKNNMFMTVSMQRKNEPQNPKEIFIF
jgi:hypothetical protein